MNNILLIQTRPEIVNGWVVKADTKRFGENEIMFEGSYDECYAYIARVEFKLLKKSKFTVYITGEKDGVRFDNDWVTNHRDGFVEQDWSKVFPWDYPDRHAENDFDDDDEDAK